MSPVAIRAEEALRDHLHPALTLSELLDLVAPHVDRTMDAGRLRSVLELHPERFRVLEPWSGSWRGGPVGRAARSDRAWVVGIADPGAAPDAPAASLRLRESVRWLSRGVDPRSAIEVSRWYAIVLAERAARETVARVAA